MGSVNYSAIRQRFATKIATVAGFTQSRNPLDGAIRTPQSVAHKRYWVGVVSSSGSSEDRQAGKVLCDTEIQVKFAYRLRPKDQITDLDGAWDVSQTLITALTTRAAPLYTNLQIRFQNISTEITGSGEFVIVKLIFSVIHTIEV